MIRLSRLVLTLVALGVLSAVSTPALADLDGYSASLKPSVTVTGAVVTLGDLFDGEIMRPEKAVAKAPEPGQRFVLGAKWLSSLARTYGIDWRPANAYDRATVYRPGQTIAQSEILDNVRDALMSQGMPNNYGLDVGTPLGNITVSTEVAPDIGVREAFYDQQERAFSAVIEIPKGAPTAQFIPIRGVAFPTMAVPMINQNVSKNTLITDSMIEWVDLPVDKVRRETVMDSRLIIGKSPRTYLRAGQTVRDTDLIQVTLVDIPVPLHDIRDTVEITEAHLQWVTVNANDIHDYTVTDMDRLIGLHPRRFLPKGAPIRVSDVHAVIPVEIPVAIRDIRRGTLVSDGDIQWITMNENELRGEVLIDDFDIVGQAARRTIRAGQVFRSRDLRVPVVVERGKVVTLQLRTPYMQLSAKGKALDSGGKTETIRVMNSISNRTVLATVVDANTVRVDTIQTVMN